MTTIMTTTMTIEDIIHDDLTKNYFDTHLPTCLSGVAAEDGWMDGYGEHFTHTLALRDEWVVFHALDD